MAEGAASWHGFVVAKRVEGGKKSEDVGAVTHDNDLAVKAKLGYSDAVSADFCLGAKRDVSIRTRMIRYKHSIFIELSMSSVAPVSAQHSSSVSMMVNSG